MKSDQILQQHFAASQIFLSASLQVCLLMSVGQSPTYRSLTFPASTHSLAMWASAALHQKRCKSNSKSIDKQQSLKKKRKFSWLCTNYCYNLASLKQRQATPAITLRSPPGRHHFCAASPPRAFFLKPCGSTHGLFSKCFSQKDLQRKRSKMTCPIASIQTDMPNGCGKALFPFCNKMSRSNISLQ